MVRHGLSLGELGVVAELPAAHGQAGCEDAAALFILRGKEQDRRSLRVFMLEIPFRNKTVRERPRVPQYAMVLIILHMHASRFHRDLGAPFQNPVDILGRLAGKGLVFDQFVFVNPT